MSNHTPGPWTVRDGDLASGVFGGHVQRELVSCHQYSAVVEKDECRANAKAISATPDFMEAARLMTAAEQSGGDMWWKGFQMLKSAYKKAGGEFPSINEI